jgi:hypothetical protein
MLLLGCVFSSSVVLCRFTLGAKERLIVFFLRMICQQTDPMLSLHVQAISSSLLL